MQILIQFHNYLDILLNIKSIVLKILKAYLQVNLAQKEILLISITFFQLKVSPSKSKNSLSNKKFYLSHNPMKYDLHEKKLLLIIAFD